MAIGLKEWVDLDDHFKKRKYGTPYVCDGCGAKTHTFPDGMPSGWIVMDNRTWPFRHHCAVCAKRGAPRPGWTHEMEDAIENSKLLYDFATACAWMMHWRGDDTENPLDQLYRLNEEKKPESI